MGKSKTVTVRGREYWRAAKEFKNDETKPKAPAMIAAVTPGRELLALVEWCRIEREKLGAIDGYDYRSGEEFGLRRAQNEIENRLAAKPADEVVREQAAKLLEARADLYSDRLSHAIFSGNLVAQELRSNASTIRALLPELKT